MRLGWTTAKGALNLLYAVLTPTPPGAYISAGEIRQYGYFYLLFFRLTVFLKAVILDSEQGRPPRTEAGLERDAGCLAQNRSRGGRDHLDQASDYVGSSTLLYWRKI
jgi:hypothetical protein